MKSTMKNLKLDIYHHPAKCCVQNLDKTMKYFEFRHFKAKIFPENNLLVNLWTILDEVMDKVNHND